MSLKLCVALDGMLNINPPDPYAHSNTCFVVVCASQLLASRTNSINHVLEYKEYCGFSVIALYNDTRNLPKECGAVLKLCSDAESSDNSESAENRLVVVGNGFEDKIYIRLYANNEEVFTKTVSWLCNSRFFAFADAFIP